MLTTSTSHASRAGCKKLLAGLDRGLDGVLPFAPPYLRAGKIVIAQTANITRYLGERLGLAPKTEHGRLAAATIAMTIADLVAEVHDTHHPITVEKAYETPEARREEARRGVSQGADPEVHAAGSSTRSRTTASSSSARQISYADLAGVSGRDGPAVRVSERDEEAAGKLKRLFALRDRVAARPRLAAYLASPRRVPFNETGIFRHYPELDP